MLGRVQPGSLRGSGGQWVSIGHVWLWMALGRELSLPVLWPSAASLRAGGRAHPPLVLRLPFLLSEQLVSAHVIPP